MNHVRWIFSLWPKHIKLLPVLFFLTLLSAGAFTAYPLVIRWIIDRLSEYDSVQPGPSWLVYAVASSFLWAAAMLEHLRDALRPEMPAYFATVIDAVIKVLEKVGDFDAMNAAFAPVKITALVWALMGIGVIRSISYLYPGTRALINNRIDMDVRERFFEIILSKGYRFFNKFRTGDLVTRLTRDVADFPKIAWFACSGIFRAVESTAKLIFIIIVMMLMNWKLALLALAPLPVMIYVFYVVRIRLALRSRAVQDAISETNDALESAFSGVRILKAYSGEERQADNFLRLLNKRIEIEMNLLRLQVFLWNTYWMIDTLGLVIVIIIGGIFVTNGSLSIGSLYAFYMFMGMLLHPLLDIPNLFATSKQAFVCVDRLEEIRNTPGGTEGLFEGILPVPAFESLELKCVKFSYDDSTPVVLDGVSLNLEAGTKAAVVGPVGCGKSTLIKMAAGMLPPQEGDVLVNGRSIHDYNIAEYRALTGYIPQEPVLFSESVKNNVVFGRDISDERVWEALGYGQVEEEVRTLTDGCDQMLGQRGLTVSGGQKQRIAIARALAGNPMLLLMDDCTASLDAANEEKFWDMFAEHFPDAACLIVTHRLATAKQADVIYVLDEGRIVGAGSHEHLLKTCEAYRNFLTRAELESILKLKA